MTYYMKKKTTVVVTFYPHKIRGLNGGYNKQFLKLINSGKFDSNGSLVKMTDCFPWIDYTLTSNQSVLDVKKYFKDFAYSIR